MEQRGGSSGRGARAPLRRLSREAPPGRDCALNRGQVPQHREEHEEPLDGLEGDRRNPPDHFPGGRGNELKEAAGQEEAEPTRTPEESCIPTPPAPALAP